MTAREERAREVLAEAYREAGQASCASYIAAGNELTPDQPVILAALEKALAFADQPLAGEEGDEVETTWEVWNGDELEAASSSEADGRHYLAVYAQDGPVRLVKAVTHRTVIASTRSENSRG